MGRPRKSPVEGASSKPAESSEPKREVGQRAADDTPVMRQFRAAKQQHPDALVFFRMGDFYELFYDDAVVAARALDLTLTSRNKNSDDEIPMAGVPHHAASGYVQRLLDQGFKVAICEQMADPKSVKGIVPREVVRVVSPGLVFDDAGVIPGQNQWVVALGFGAPCAFAALDFGTGELLSAELQDHEALLAELTRFAPKEIVVEPEIEAEHMASLNALCPKTMRRIAAAQFAGELGVLDEVIGVEEALRVQPSAVARGAAGALVRVLRSAEPMLQKLPLRLLAHEPGATLLLDEKAQRHLELVQSLSGEHDTSLLALLDDTRTPAGARLLRRRLLAPLCEVTPIRRRHDQVEALLANPREREALREALREIGDLERIAVKLAVGRAQPKNLGTLRRSLLALPEVVRAIRASCNSLVEAHLEIPSDDCADLAALLASALGESLPARLGDGPLFAPGYDAELDELRTLLQNGESLLLELEERLRTESQIPSLKLRYTRVFGHYVEVTRSNLSRAPKTWRRKQTVATGERFTTEELDDLSERLALAEDRLAARERLLFEHLCARLAESAPRLRQVMVDIASWDVAANLAELAHRHDYARPEVDDSVNLDIEEGRHPVVERMLQTGAFVANDCTLHASEDDEHSRFWILTGPNMAGKSTFMRQIALITVLAQMGSFVPAKRARIGLCDRILTRVGASDDLARGESTFMVEMKETAHVLRRASRRSLVVLDEIGRGTSTFDGLAIAWSVAEHLHDVARCRALFATHYHELTELVKTRPSAENYSVSAKEHDGKLVFFHAIERGAASESYGIACARLAGVPESVVTRARALLGDLEARGRQKQKTRQIAPPQLGLFESSPTPPTQTQASVDPALVTIKERLTALQLEHTTPIDALVQLAELKRLLDA